MSQTASPYIAFLAFAGAFLSTPVNAIEVVVDYRYDTNDFFDPSNADGQLARVAIEAAAARFSNVISSPLLEARLRDDNDDARIGFTHPATGNPHQVSGASSSSTDTITTAGGPTASEYTGGFTIAEDEWILFAGARPLSSAGIGGTGTGTNFSNLFEGGDSHLNRGFRQTGSFANLPVWGGAISFDNSGSLDWHFDHTTESPTGSVDFYSIALHEIGHALGLATSWEEWAIDTQGDTYVGSEALATYNANNDSQLDSFQLQEGGGGHWKDGTYQSLIFAPGQPNLSGTVGLEARQDLLMEPTANFTPSVRRFELTNVDVAALRDIGWTIDDSPALACDLDNDQDCDIQDLDALIVSIRSGDATLSDRQDWLSVAANEQGKPSPFLLGDTNLDGDVNASDLNVLGQHWNQPSGLWSQGDFNASGQTDAADLNELGIHWQQSNMSQFAAVPEPNFGALMTCLTFALLLVMRRSASPVCVHCNFLEARSKLK